MTEIEILEGIKEYFSAYEFVGRKTFKKHGERSWKFFDFRLLHTMYILRKNIGRKVTVNTWKWGGKFSQRGLRTTVQQIMKNVFVRNILYLSAHVLGKGIDFDVEGMTAQEVRQWIIDNQHLFKYKIRLEATVGGKPITWVHLDIVWELKNPKVYLFAA